MDTLDLMDTTAEMEIATESSRDIFNTDTGSGSLDAATVSAALGELGHWGQVTIVWFSIGVAVWQLVTVGTQLLAAGFSPLREVLGRSVDGGKSKLVSGSTRDLIEMGFWVLKFIGDFEKQYDKNSAPRSADTPAPKEERTSNAVGKLFSDNARTYLKFMRYVSKFLSTHENFQKKIKSRQ